ncbi:MAG: transposase [Deltaproteobacteria bacterium]|nr:MAG: transposase [Deltaproteobacteria bacterium]
MPKTRKNYTDEQKVSILRSHLIEKVPVSNLCEELGLQPTVFYRWQKTLFENGALVFQRHPDNNKRTDRKIAALEAKLLAKNEVLSELMEEHVALKKSLGEV